MSFVSFKNYYISVNNFQFEIIDSDFEEVILATNIADAIIQVYGGKGLNIAANLALLIVFITKSEDYSISEIASEFSLFSYAYEKYREDVERYLMLL